MINQYPWWKYLFVLLTLCLGGIYTLPNLYPADAAVQITGANPSTPLNETTQKDIEKALQGAGLPFKSLESSSNAIIVRLNTSELQQRVKTVVKNALGDDYIVALNLAQTTPEWLRGIGAYPMKLGLDLSGGVHFLLEVDTEKAVFTKMHIASGEVRAALRKDRIRYRTVIDKGIERQLAFSDSKTRDQAIKVIEKLEPDMVITKYANEDRHLLAYRYSDTVMSDIEDYAVRQNLTTVRNRVNELGVSEPLVQRQGRTGIVVELPGVQDTAEAKRILGKTANLEFRLEALPGASRLSTEQFGFKDGRVSNVRLERDIIITGENVSSAQANFDADTNMPQVNINLDNLGGTKMNRATRVSVGRSMAVLFLEQKPVTQTKKKIVDGKEVEEKVVKFKEDKKIISLATIQSPLGNQFRITGLAGRGEASELALLLRAGSLAAPMHFAEERTVGPSLGAENVRMGIDSTIIGLILLVMFMLVVYRIFGVFANIALGFNLVILTAVMSLFGATLTLPGIAGIVLTLGMAVDANVLIFSRIREELKLGQAVQKAIHEGFNRAFVSIFDGNITTLLVGVILFAVGTGPVKGFAVTLSIGIVTSMFTAITVTRALVNLFYGGRHVKTLSI